MPSYLAPHKCPASQARPRVGPSRPGLRQATAGQATAHARPEHARPGPSQASGQAGQGGGDSDVKEGDAQSALTDNINPPIHFLIF